MSSPEFLNNSPEEKPTVKETDKLADELAKLIMMGLKPDNESEEYRRCIQSVVEARLNAPTVEGNIVIR